MDSTHFHSIVEIRVVFCNVKDVSSSEAGCAAFRNACEAACGAALRSDCDELVVLVVYLFW